MKTLKTIIIYTLIILLLPLALVGLSVAALVNWRGEE